MSDLVGNLEDLFSHNEAHIKPGPLVCYILVVVDCVGVAAFAFVIERCLNGVIENMPRFVYYKITCIYTLHIYM